MKIFLLWFKVHIVSYVSYLVSHVCILQELLRSQ